MDGKLARAIEEADAFLAAHKAYSDNREVRCITPFSDDYPQLSLGTVRAALAALRELK